MTVLQKLLVAAGESMGIEAINKLIEQRESGAFEPSEDPISMVIFKAVEEDNLDYINYAIDMLTRAKLVAKNPFYAGADEVIDNPFKPDGYKLGGHDVYRDSTKYALKASYTEINGDLHEIMKTDDGVELVKKRSLQAAIELVKEGTTGLLIVTSTKLDGANYRMPGGKVDDDWNRQFDDLRDK